MYLNQEPAGPGTGGLGTISVREDEKREDRREDGREERRDDRREERRDDRREDSQMSSLYKCFGS